MVSLTILSNKPVTGDGSKLIAIVPIATISIATVSKTRVSLAAVSMATVSMVTAFLAIGGSEWESLGMALATALTTG